MDKLQIIKHVSYDEVVFLLWRFVHVFHNTCTIIAIFVIVMSNGKKMYPRVSQQMGTS